MGWFWDSDEEKAAKEAKEKFQNRFREQLYLSAILPKLVAHKQEERTFDRFSSLTTSKPDQILNLLNYLKGIETFQDIKPHELAMLVPEIRVFQEFVDTKKQTEV